MRLRSRRKHYERRVDKAVTHEEYEEIRCVRLNPEQVASRDEEEKRLHFAIDALPEKLRSVLEIKELQERTMEETASLLGISVTAAKARLFRAKGLLKRRVLKAVSRPSHSTSSGGGSYRSKVHLDREGAQ